MSANKRSLVRGHGLRAQLFRGGAGSLGLRIVSIGLRLGLLVILARLLGPEGYGIYTYVYALIIFLVFPAEFGLPTLVVRETARSEASQQWGLMRGLWRWAGLCVVGFSLLFAMIGAGVAVFFSQDFSALQLATFTWGLVLVPFLAMVSLQQAALRGLRKVVQGQLTEKLFRPALLILLILVCSTFAKSNISANQAMALQALAAAIVCAISAWLLRRARPEALASRPTPEYETRDWVGSVLPLALITGVSLINQKADILMLGLFGNAPQDIGIYNIAVQGALLASLGVLALSQVLEPHFARLHAQADMAQLQRLTTAGARAGLLLAAPAALIFFFFGGDILRIIFGAGYASGYLALAILAGAEFLRSGFGQTLMLLNMSGYERDAAKCVAVAAGCNVILNAMLIPLYGMTGAAIGTGAAILIQNAAFWIMIRGRLGVDPSALGILHHWNNVTTPREEPGRRTANKNAS